MECALQQGPDKAMNLYNTKKQKKPKKQETGTEKAPEVVENANVNSSAEGI